MSKKRTRGKHLSLEERYAIQHGLKEHRTFSEIAFLIGCSPDTISKEIRKHRYLKKEPIQRRRPQNNCKHRYTCKRRDVCNKPKGHKCRIPCRECLRCNALCPYFVYAPCNINEKAPYVCNNCRKSGSCFRDKYLYNADYAHREYLTTLSKSRQGIDLTKDELIALDELVSPLIKKGKPITHIMQHHGDEIPCSIRTLYNYVENGYLSAKTMDLRRAVRYKKRKAKKTLKTSPRKKVKHHYKDFKKLLELYPDTEVVEMDTVEGVKGGKLLHTFLWRKSKLMLAFLLDNKEMNSTVAVIDELEEKLGIEAFRELFPIILTDNGNEFADPDMFEFNRAGEKRTSIYYCEPSKSNQKGSLERNHEYIRFVVPKGKAFDNYNQEQITLMVNHINSVARPGLGGRSPISVAEERFGEENIKKLGLTAIEPDEIELMPSLLK